MEYEYTTDSSQLDISEIEYYPPGFSIDTQYLSVPGLGFGNLAAKYAGRTSVKEKVSIVDCQDDGNQFIVVVVIIVGGG